MTHSRATGYTPFFMVYGTKVVLPTDLDYGALRVMQYREQEAKEYLEMPWINLMMPATLLSSTQPNTSRHYADTTTIGSRVEPSTLGT
jgi:hypothetical protein